MMAYGLVQERKRLSTLLPASSLLHTAVRPVAELPVTDGGNGSHSGGLKADFSQMPAQTSEPTAECSASPRLCPTGGACHTCPLRVQAKQPGNQPGDEYEQEADRIAEQVTMEPRFGLDLSRVPKHADSSKPTQTNLTLQVRALYEFSPEEEETEKYSSQGVLMTLAGSGTCQNGGAVSACDPTNGAYTILGNNNTCCTKLCS